MNEQTSTRIVRWLARREWSALLVALQILQWLLEGEERGGKGRGGEGREGEGRRGEGRGREERGGKGRGGEGEERGGKGREGEGEEREGETSGCRVASKGRAIQDACTCVYAHTVKLCYSYMCICCTAHIHTMHVLYIDIHMHPFTLPPTHLTHNKLLSTTHTHHIQSFQGSSLNCILHSLMGLEYWNFRVSHQFQWHTTCEILYTIPIL